MYTCIDIHMYMYMQTIQPDIYAHKLERGVDARITILTLYLYNMSSMAFILYVIQVCFDGYRTRTGEGKEAMMREGNFTSIL